MGKNITKVLLGGKLLHPSNFVAAVEFGGKDVTLTIASVQIEQLQRQGGKDNKPTLAFKETRKKLVLNKTNAGTIADMYGTRAEEWIGKRVTFYPAKTGFGGETVDCIRVRSRVPGSSAPPPPQAVVDPPEAEDEPDVFASKGAAVDLPIGDANAQPPANLPDHFAGTANGQGTLIS
jgi:hypothetical protein